MTGVLPGVGEDSDDPWSRVLRGAGALLLSAERFEPHPETPDPLHALMCEELVTGLAPDAEDDVALTAVRLPASAL